MASYIKSLFWGTPQDGEPPLLVPTDEIVPMHVFDDLAGYRTTSVAWTCRFDEVLDGSKLQDGMRKLLEMDGWRKLGGRLRKTEFGKVEIHIPRPFTTERPPLRYSQANEDMAMDEHPLASQLPKPTGRLETYPSPRYFRSLSVGPNAPDKFEDYLKGDEPQIALHVVNFEDGTLVSLVFLHTLCDMMGFASLLKSWSLAVAGKFDQIPPFLGFREDPMAGLYNAEPSKPYLLAAKQMIGWKMLVWGIRFLVESWWYPPLESRTICLPDELVLALRKKAKKDLIESVGQENGEVPFISDGDIITAVVTRMACEELRKSSNRSVTTILGVDSRTRAPSIFRQDAAYVQNAAVGAFSFGSASEILKSPLGLLALKYRNDLIAQLDLDQVIGLCRLNLETLRKSGNAVMFGDTSTILAVVQSWSKARCFDIIDFSAAITSAEDAISPAHTFIERKSKPGHPIFWHLQTLATPKFSPTVFGVIGRDAKGNMWLTGDLRPSVWSVFEDYMNRTLLENKVSSECN